MSLITADILFYTIVTVPLLAILVGMGLRSRSRRFLVMVECGLLAAGTIGLAVQGDRLITPSMAFMGEPISFSVSMTGVFLFVALLLGLISLIILDDRADLSLSRFGFILVQLSLSAGFLAMMSGQFMIRYMALDLVGLLAALSVLKGFRSEGNYRKFAFVFLMLRLGDLCLLAGILLVNAHAGTLQITQMISAAEGLPITEQNWALLGFILAVLIKSAIWPFGIWQRHARQTAAPAVFWISGFLMPALGAYLLYRIVPLIASRAMLLVVGQGLSLALFLSILISGWLSQARPDRFIQLNGLMSCFVLSAAAIPGTDFFGTYLAGLILFRLAVILAQQQHSFTKKAFLGMLAGLANGIFLWVNAGAWPPYFSISWGALTGIALVWIGLGGRSRGQQESTSREIVLQPNGTAWVVGIRWLHHEIEEEVLSKGFLLISREFIKSTHWLQKHIEGGFEKAWSAAITGLTRASQATLAALEAYPAEKTEGLVEDALGGLARYEKNVLKKALRWDLALIPLFLAAIILVLSIV